MKLGVLGGTFDPIHVGHLVLAEEVRVRLGLDEVLFVPAGNPWFKADVPITAAGHRLRMVRLAIAGKPHFKLSTMEVERPGRSYTVDTMAELRGTLASGDELFFILGWDNLRGLPRWREPERLITLCRLVAVPRVGEQAPDLNTLEASIPGLSKRVIMLDKPQIAVSASEVRERAAGGLPIEHLVPQAVEGYIREQGLYRGKR